MMPIPCCILGMPAQERYTYEYFFREFGAGRYTLVADAEHAAILLIDVDSAEGHRLAQLHFRAQRPGQTAIAISANHAHPEHVLLLPKPVSPTTLQTLLDKLSSSQTPAPLPTPAAATAPGPERIAPAALAMEDDSYSHYLFHADADPSHMAADQLYFDAGQHLLGALEDAWRDAQAQQLAIELRTALGSVRLYPAAHRLHSDFNDKVLRSLAVAHTPIERITLGPAGTVSPPAGSEAIAPYLWRLAAWTSRGRLPAGTDPDTPVHLRRWPNMTRLLATPHSMQIAALWTGGVYTLGETARRLMISHGDVHVFYCCTRAVGLTIAPQPATAAPVPAAAHAPEPVVAQPSRSRGLLSRILGRLLARSA